MLQGKGAMDGVKSVPMGVEGGVRLVRSFQMSYSMCLSIFELCC
jgi:hypothetical protein